MRKAMYNRKKSTITIIRSLLPLSFFLLYTIHCSSSKEPTIAPPTQVQQTQAGSLPDFWQARDTAFQAVCSSDVESISAKGEILKKGKKTPIPGVCEGNCQDGIGHLKFSSGSFLWGNFSKGTFVEGFSYPCQSELYEGRFNEKGEPTIGKLYSLDFDSKSIKSTAEGEFKKGNFYKGTLVWKDEDGKEIKDNGEFEKDLKLKLGNRQYLDGGYQEGSFKEDKIYNGTVIQYVGAEKHEQKFDVKNGGWIEKPRVYLYDIIPTNGVLYVSKYKEIENRVECVHFFDAKYDNYDKHNSGYCIKNSPNIAFNTNEAFKYWILQEKNKFKDIAPFERDEEKKKYKTFLEEKKYTIWMDTLNDKDYDVDDQIFRIKMTIIGWVSTTTRISEAVIEFKLERKKAKELFEKSNLQLLLYGAVSNPKDQIFSQRNCRFPNIYATKSCLSWDEFKKNIVIYTVSFSHIAIHEINHMFEKKVSILSPVLFESKLSKPGKIEVKVYEE